MVVPSLYWTAWTSVGGRNWVSGNYVLFVLETFHSRKQEVHMENFCSQELLFHGNFCPRNESVCGTFTPWEHLFVITFVPSYKIIFKNTICTLPASLNNDLMYVNLWLLVIVLLLVTVPPLVFTVGFVIKNLVGSLVWFLYNTAVTREFIPRRVFTARCDA